MRTAVKKDKRIREILAQLRNFSEGDFTRYLSISERVDGIDAIIAGLNVLCEALAVRQYGIENREERIAQLREILLRYTLMDFSEKAAISPAGDVIDALAAGLNALGEEVVHHHSRLKDSEEQVRILKGVLEQGIAEKAGLTENEYK
jgi:hypothetical protein